MKTLKLIFLLTPVFLLFNCSKIEESSLDLSGSFKLKSRSLLKIQINADVETLVLNKLKNPNEISQLEIQDKIFLVPNKTRYDFKSYHYEDGTMETEMTVLNPGGMTEVRNDAPPSDLPSIHKIIVSNGHVKMFDSTNSEIMDGPFDLNFMSAYSLDLINRIINGYPDIMAYAQYIDNLPGGNYTLLNSRYIRVNYPVSSGNQICEVYDLNIKRLVGFIIRDNTGNLISRQLISYDCTDSVPLPQRTWTQTYSSTVNGFETVEETTQYFHNFEIIEI